MTTHEQNKYLIEKLYNEFVREFNEDTANRIFRLLEDVIGRKRVTFHSGYLYYRQRNKLIKRSFTGKNFWSYRKPNPSNSSFG